MVFCNPTLSLQKVLLFFCRVMFLLVVMRHNVILFLELHATAAELCLNYWVFANDLETLQFYNHIDSSDKYRLLLLRIFYAAQCNDELTKDGSR